MKGLFSRAGENMIPAPQHQITCDKKNFTLKNFFLKNFQKCHVQQETPLAIALTLCLLVTETRNKTKQKSVNMGFMYTFCIRVLMNVHFFILLYLLIHFLTYLYVMNETTYAHSEL